MSDKQTNSTDEQVGEENREEHSPDESEKDESLKEAASQEEKAKEAPETEPTPEPEAQKTPEPETEPTPEPEAEQTPEQDAGSLPEPEPPPETEPPVQPEPEPTPEMDAFMQPEPIPEPPPLQEAPPEPPPEEEIIDMSDIPGEDIYSAEERAEMEARYEETMKIFRYNELVTGKVVAISESDVAVDIGFKSEGNIPVEEFDNLDGIKVGDEIEVLIDRIEDEAGTLVLSKRKAEFTRIWENINLLYQTGEMVEAQIIKRIKGGMVVDLFGVESFLPGSQIDVHPVRDFDALVGITMDFRIIKVNNARKNVVLSHKVLVEESLREIREKVLAEIEEGQVVEGIVKNITDFGVFIDLGGVDGLLHITDLSWGRVSHPSDVVKLDEKVKVKVLRYDREKQRISLGLKQLKEHHWDEIEENYPVGSKVKGRVVSLVKYGAFVELQEGIEGLVHISEMSWTQHVKHPSQIVSAGDEIDIMILNVDRENRKISLGMKQCLEDPWERLEKTFQPGTRHKGLVRDLVPFGAFVELEQNIDGLIHISDLSWVRKVRHPGEIVKKGEEIEVIVLNFDRNERRIALGFKQLEPDPWDGFEKEYPIRVRTEGSVVRVLEKGVVVMLHLGVEGFVPNSQLGKSLSDENKRNIKEGDAIELEVIEFDKVNHRIVLSHSIIERAREKTVYRAYRDVSSGEGKATFGDLIRESKKELEEKKQPPKDIKDFQPEPPAEEPVGQTFLSDSLEEKKTEPPAETVEPQVALEPDVDAVKIKAEEPEPEGEAKGEVSEEIKIEEPAKAPEPDVKPEVSKETEVEESAPDEEKKAPKADEDKAEEEAEAVIDAKPDEPEADVKPKVSRKTGAKKTAPDKKKKIDETDKDKAADVKPKASRKTKVKKTAPDKKKKIDETDKDKAADVKPKVSRKTKVKKTALVKEKKAPEADEDNDEF